MPGTDGRALETESEDAIIAAAMTMGYLAHAQRPGRNQDGKVRTAVKGHPGRPDLIIVGFGHIFVYELKRRGGHFQPGQNDWLEKLAEIRTDKVRSGVLWVPEQQQLFIDRLREIRDAWMLG